MVAPSINSSTVYTDSVASKEAHSFSHTVPSGIDALIVVITGQGGNDDFSWATGGEPDWNSVDLTEVFNNDADTTGSADQFIWVGVEFSPAAGTHDVTYEYAGQNHHSAVVLAYNVVDIETASVAAAFNELVRGMEHTDSAAIDLTFSAAGSSGNTLWGITCSRGGDTNPTTLTTGTGWTNTTDEQSGTHGSNDHVLTLWTKELSGTDTGIVVDWAGGVTDQSSGTVLELVAASGGTTHEDSGNLDVALSLSGSVGLSIDETAALDFGMSIAVVDDISQEVSATMSFAVGMDPSTILTAEETATFGVALSMIGAGGGTINEAVSLAWAIEMAATEDVSQEEAVNLSLAYNITPAFDIVIVEPDVLNIGYQMTMSVSVEITSTVNLDLSYELEPVAILAVDAQGEMSIAYNFGGAAGLSLEETSALDYALGLSGQEAITQPTGDQVSYVPVMRRRKR